MAHQITEKEKSGKTQITGWNTQGCFPSHKGTPLANFLNNHFSIRRVRLASCKIFKSPPHVIWRGLFVIHVMLPSSVIFPCRKAVLVELDASSNLQECHG